MEEEILYVVITTRESVIYVAATGVYAVHASNIARSRKEFLDGV
jgi:hypothetical protein